MPHQKFESANIKPRYSKGKVSVWGVNSVYPRTPWVSAWWSAAFPGFGHMYLGKYLHGIILFIWELVVNNSSHLNMAIALSFLGKFEEAKAILHPNWALLYIAVYIFCIWDSYRCAVEIKKAHLLSEIEDAPVTPSVVSYFDINILEKRNPLMASLWSFFTPGLGQLYGSSTIVGTFILAWWIFVCYKAMAVSALLYSFQGDFDRASQIVDWQWVLFMPSILAFAIYQAYVAVTENNTLFDIEQIRYLRVRSKNLGQLNNDSNNTVQIIATFDHSPFVEIAIHDMEKLGIQPENIIALPVENLDAQTHIIDTIHRVDGTSILDGAMMSATVFSVLGVIYGFAWHWGPIIWGLIGLIGGFALGLIIELLVNKKKIKVFPNRKSEVIIEITCHTSLQNQLIQVLKSRKAIGYVIMPQRL
nr:hypothetical protein [Lysinibacillus timonensis]